MTGITAALASPFPGFSVSLSDRAIADLTTDGSPATATYEIRNDGTIRNQDGTSLETWLSHGSTSNWDVRATLSSGTSPSGSAVGSWLNCGTTRSWSLTDSAQDGVSIVCELVIELRSGGIVATSATIDLQAIASDPA